MKLHRHEFMADENDEKESKNCISGCKELQKNPCEVLGRKGKCIAGVIGAIGLVQPLIKVLASQARRT